MIPAQQPLLLVEIGGGSLSLPSAWEDATDEFTEGRGGPPWTICRREGPGGALQLTLSWYHGGKEPRPSDQELLVLARGWGEKFGGKLLDENTFRSGPLLWATASYREQEAAEDTFWQVWYGSDGRNFVYVTYNCVWSLRWEERDALDAIVRSFRFELPLAQQRPSAAVA